MEMHILPDQIFIGDLPSKISEATLEQSFSQYGKINYVTIYRPRNYNSWPSASIQFASKDSAKAALEDTNVIILNKMPLFVTPYVENWPEVEKSEKYTCRDLKVTKLAPEVTSGDLKGLFAPLNSLFSAKIMLCEVMPGHRIESRRFGFAQFYNEYDANKACIWLQGRLDSGEVLLGSPEMEVLPPGYRVFAERSNIGFKNYKIVKELFEPFGEISCIEFITTKKWHQGERRSRIEQVPIAVVRFKDQESAEWAVAESGSYFCDEQEEAAYEQGHNRDVDYTMMIYSAAQFQELEEQRTERITTLKAAAAKYTRRRRRN